MNDSNLIAKVFAAVVALAILVSARVFFNDKSEQAVRSSTQTEMEARCAPAVEIALLDAVDFAKTLSAINVKSARDTKFAKMHESRLRDLNWARGGLQQPADSKWHREVLESQICREGIAGSISMVGPDHDAAPANESYEQMVRRTWKEAAESNREADKAQDQMLEEYRRNAKSAKTSNQSGVRIDTFIMPSGEIVVCRTTFRNNARATSC